MDIKIKKSTKILLAVAAAFLLASAMLYIPAVQGLLMRLGGVIRGRTLQNPAKWIASMKTAAAMCAICALIAVTLAVWANVPQKYYQHIVFVAWFFLSAICAVFALSRLTYLEFVTKGSTNGAYTVISQKKESRTVDFDMPYDFVRGVSLQIGTFAHDNNSEWELEILEKDSGRIIAKSRFDASRIVDNQWHFVDFGKNIRGNKTKAYQIRITAKDVADSTALAFYAENDVPCIRIHGGDFDAWWVCFTVLCSAFLLAMILRFRALRTKGISVFDDRMLVGMIVCCVVFALFFFFKNSSMFTDENDNMNGGLLISHGRVLYRDYVTQHTPFAYYLCSLFALLGAKSVEQFRLSYYLLEGLVFGLLYIRHSARFGRWKMAMLPIVEIVALNVAVRFGGAMVLSDSIEGICFVALLLEFLSYCDDGKIGWRRATIVSACVWFSFGSAFVSAYSLVWIALAVVCMECRRIVRKEIPLKDCLARTGRIFLVFFLPLCAAMLYFALNNAFVEAVRQFYVFNRRVYPVYTGYGTHIMQPIVFSAMNFGKEIQNNFTAVLSSPSPAELLKLLVLSFAFIASVGNFLRTKRIAVSAVPFLVMVMAGSRGYGFHGIAAWNVAVLIIVLNTGNCFTRVPKVAVPFAALFAFYLSSIFVFEICYGISRPQSQISDFESLIINLTNENEEIFIDGWTCIPNYLLYKRRFPVNKTLYQLPWYMDWYESDTIKELQAKRPRFAIFNKNSEVWGYRGFAPRLHKALEADYVEISPNLWQRADILRAERVK